MKVSITLTCWFALMWSTAYTQNWTYYATVQNEQIKNLKNGTLFKTNVGYFIVESAPFNAAIPQLQVDVFKNQNNQYLFRINEFRVDVICSKISELVKTSIEGNFNGWRLNQIFQMQDGTEWRQISHEYDFKYSLGPDVIIYKVKDEYRLTVDDIDNFVLVKKLECY